MKKTILLLGVLATLIQAQSGTVITTGFVSNYVPPSPTNEENGCIPPRIVPPNGNRLFSIYLPPNYNPADTNTRYPVVYWCVGFNGIPEQPAQLNQILLDQAINTGEMIPMIVVHPDPSLALTFRLVGNTGTPCPPGPGCRIPGFDPSFVSYGNSFYINSALNNVQYETYFIEELVPYIDAHYNTIPDRNFRAIAGQSMGGYAALLLGMRYPQVFAAFCAESPTPPWMFTNPETWPNPPAYDAFTLNSIMIFGIMANDGFVSPCNEGFPSEPGFNDFVFSMAGSLSPNTTGGTSFTDVFQVNLPIIVDENGRASLVDGTFSVVDFSSPPYAVATTVVDKSVVLDQSVIDIWHQNDPYFLLESYIDTLAQQAIYLDGGDEEPLNNVGSRMVSDRLMTYTIDNEYILYSGEHTSFIFDPCCARNTTAFKMCSGQFSAAGTNSENISSKLMGTLTINLCDESQLNVCNGSILSVQTSRTIPSITNPVSSTNVTFDVQDQAAIHIGTATIPGGALQIGDPFTKAQLQEYNTGPSSSFTNHTVEGAFYLHGSQALLEIGKEGFLGIGIGVTGRSNAAIAYAPTIANYWAVSSLANLNNILFNLDEGTFSHNVITSGDRMPASLFGIDLSSAYIFNINPASFVILGGGNMICTKLDTNFNANPPAVDRKARLLNPTVLNIGNTLPSRFLDPAAGVINVANFNDNVLDPYTANPISSSTAYTNFFQRGILQSTPLFARGDVPTPFYINTNSTDSLCDFLLTKPYITQPIKLANISPNPKNPTLGFVQDASLIEEFVSTNVPFIERVGQADLPNQVDIQVLETTEEQGAIGIQLEYINSSADLPAQGIFNLKRTIRIYNPHTELIP